MSQSFRDRVAIITGAGGGIGSAAVAELLERGASVVAVDKDEAALDALAKAQKTDRLTTFAGDVSEESTCRDYVARAVEAYDGVDHFIGNAAIGGVRVPIVEFDPMSFDPIFAVNVKAMALGLKHVFKQMMKQDRGGSVVLTASIGGFREAKCSCWLYGSSKAAVISLAKSASLQGSKFGVRVNAICPGHIDTRMVSKKDTSGGVNPYAGNPIPRLGHPTEAAKFMAYLLSDDASYQTGGIYTIDGGQSLV